MEHATHRHIEHAALNFFGEAQAPPSYRTRGFKFLYRGDFMRGDICWLQELSSLVQGFLLVPRRNDVAYRQIKHAIHRHIKHASLNVFADAQAPPSYRTRVFKFLYRGDFMRGDICWLKVLSSLVQGFLLVPRRNDVHSSDRRRHSSASRQAATIPLYLPTNLCLWG